MKGFWLLTKFKSLSHIVFYFGVMLSILLIPQSRKCKSFSAFCSIFKLVKKLIHILFYCIILSFKINNTILEMEIIINTFQQFLLIPIFKYLCWSANPQTWIIIWHLDI